MIPAASFTVYMSDIFLKPLDPPGPEAKCIGQKPLAEQLKDEPQKRPGETPNDPEESFLGSLEVLTFISCAVDVYLHLHDL